MRRATFRARCSSTMTMSSIPIRSCRTPCRRPACSPAWSARWGLRPTTPSSSMTVPGCSRRRACAGCSARWAPGTCSCWKAALDHWKAEGRPLTAEPTKVAPNLFEVSFDAGKVADLAEMRRIVETGERQIADARPAGRFSGADPEPREGVRGGHMPGAASVPATSLSKDGKLLPPEALREIFDKAGVDLDKPSRYVMRLRCHSGGDFAGTGNAWPQGQQAVRRIMERMGRTQ